MRGRPRTFPANTDLLKQRHQLRVVPGLPFGHEDADQQSDPIDSQVGLRGQSFAVSAEAFSYHCGGCLEDRNGSGVVSLW